MPERKKKKPIPPKISPANINESLEFHTTFPITLTHMEGKYNKICCFQCKDHMIKYIKRLNLSAKECKIEDTKPKTNND
jgi:hypothetical protein